MKHSMAVPVRFLGLVVAVSALLLVVVGLTVSDPFARTATFAAWPVLVAGTAIAAVLSALHMVRRPLVPLVALPLFFVTMCFVLVVGVVFLEPLHRDAGTFAQVAAVPRGLFVRDGNQAVLVLGQEGTRLRRTVAVSFDGVPRLRYADELAWEPAAGMAIDPASGAVVQLRRQHLPRNSARAVPLIIGFTRTLVLNAVEVIGGARASLTETVHTVGPPVVGLAVALCAVWVGARMTRWPLLNMCLAFVVVGMVFLVPTLLPRAVELAGGFSVPLTIPQIMGALWVGCACACFLPLFFMPRFREWHRNTWHDEG